MLLLALRNLARRPVRSTLTAGGLAAAIAVLGSLSGFGEGYRRGLTSELDRMGMQMMLVPLGCPYDAAARVLKGNTLENSLPAEAVEAARLDAAVAVAAPMLVAAIPRPGEGRTDMWVGMDESARDLKPWWEAREGAAWFTGPDSVILGAEAAEVELRAPGDRLHSPETGRTFRVAGVLRRSGTSDDSLFFVPLKSAQAMFHQEGRLTAVALRLRDPARLREASERLQRIPGAQVVSLTEMMGTFLNLVGVARTLLGAIAMIAVTASALSVFNSLLAATLEQTPELSLMRAVGASRLQIFALVTGEALLLGALGTLAGVLLAAFVGPLFEGVVKRAVPMAPSESIMLLNAATVLRCVAVGLGVAVLAGIYPAWRASRIAPALAMRSL